jgi:hypothetical protein
MQDIKKILKQASEALQVLQNGRSFPSQYVVQRLNVASEKFPKDHLIGNMREVFTKIASRSEFITQAQIAEAYNSLHGFSSEHEAIKSELGNLLPSSMNVANPVSFGAAAQRANEEIHPEPLNLSSEVSDAFSKIFPVKEVAASKFSEGIYKKAEKFAMAQLESIECKPSSISIVDANDHFALCLASYEAPSSFVSIKVPVQISEGNVEFPNAFVREDQLIPLTKENVYVEIADQLNQKKASLKNKFATDRREAISIDPVVVPAGLKQFTEIENELVAAANHFTPSDLRFASNLVSSELLSCGVKNPQLKVASSDKASLTFSASIPTALGRKEVSIPVEFHNGKPILPSKFFHGALAFDLDIASLSKFANENLEEAGGVVSRENDGMENMSFHELSDLVTAGVIKKDYKLSEDALDAINLRYPDQFKFALDSFSRSLKSASATSLREKLIKEAIKRGDLISVSTSVEPYSPKYGRPVSKLDFDENGELIPAHRKQVSEQQMVLATNSSKIILN